MAKGQGKGKGKGKGAPVKAKVYDYSELEKGMKLQAESDGKFYPAEVVAVSKKDGGTVKIGWIGYTAASNEWMGGDRLRSKHIHTKKEKGPPQYDYSELEKGMKLQVESDGKYYSAVVVAVGGKKAKTPIKINFAGYTSASDEWVGGERIRSKHLTMKDEDEKAPRRRPMPAAAKRILLVTPKIVPPLDPDFNPVVLGKRAYLEATKDCTDKLEWALLRSDGCGRYTLPVFEDGHKDIAASVYLAGVLIQEMLWMRSGYELQLAGPIKVCKAVKRAFSKGGAYEYEVKSMPNVCGTPTVPFKVTIVESSEALPANKDSPQVCGKDASGCRLAFDLGKSDIKTVAVKDGEVLDSAETEWDVTNKDPQYHFDAIVAAMRKTIENAKAKGKGYDKIEAVGGSATGTVSADNDATWCDIFPNVPPDVYKAKVVDIFKRIAKEVAGDVPLKVINDGEVTALAAVQKIKKGNVMGISMGSSEGGGYANADGNLLGWINELCYIRLDLNPKAPTDPWTKGAHTGISHLYLGQRGATKLAVQGGVEVPDNYKFPHKDMCTNKHETHAQCLKLIQAAMKDPEKKENASKIYETVGVYLGYGLGQYCEFYKIDHVMILGRVSKGDGGDLMLETAKKVLKEEFPEHANIEFHTADDHFKAVGQCIAAAALPSIK